MDTYRPPLDDIRFAITRLADFAAIEALPVFSDINEELVGTVLAEAGRLFAEQLAPLNRVGDTRGLTLRDGAVIMPEGFAAFYRQLVEGGWISLPFPAEEGGQGFPSVVNFAIVEMMQSANMAFSMCPLLASAAVATLRSFADDEVRARFIPPLVSGQWAPTMALTEPQSGSDLSGITTKAQRNGDHYLLRGQKMFISYGDHDMADNIAHLVLARLPDAPEGVKGISLFVVPKYRLDEKGQPTTRNDVSVVSLEHKMGLLASPTCVLSFGDDSGAEGYLVGQENNGLACMFTMMNHARLQVGMQGAALTERAFQHALAYAQERRQGRVPGHSGTALIAEHADVRRMLLMMKVGAQSMRNLIYVTAGTMDLAEHGSEAEQRKQHGRRLELLTPVVKGWCTEFCQELVGLAVQVYGGMGFVNESGVSQYMRDARVITIYEGTSGIQAADLVGRKVLRDGGAALADLVLAMRGDIDAAPQQSGDQAARFGEAVDELESATEALLALQSEQVSAVAFSFMMLTGTVAAGWQMLRAAQLQQQQVSSLDFYLDFILPRAFEHARVVRSGGASVQAFPAAALA
tara:strand:- start:113194 stop:114921 length:1728 start_codon:yes stop_codon:yes gene_type:complete